MPRAIYPFRGSISPRKRYARLTLATVALLLSACQIAPKATKVTETTQRDLVQIIEKTQRPLQVTDATVLIDVRSSFDFGLNHVQNSRQFSWQNLAENTQTAEPMRDKQKSIARLALLGVTPDTPIIILGYGQAGQGEDGRLAWDLLSLGFQDVQISAVEAFRKIMTPNESAPVLNEKAWKPNPRPELQIDKSEFLFFAGRSKAQRLARHVFIIDVRSAKENVKKGKADYGLMYMEWKQFFTTEGRPNPEIRNKLSAVGISPADRILLISNRGIRSGAAAYALLALGFPHVQNFVGGYNSL